MRILQISTTFISILNPPFHDHLHTILSTWHWSVLVTIPKPFSCEMSIKKTSWQAIFKVFLSASILQQFRCWPLQLCLPAFPLGGEIMVMAVSNWHPVTIGLSGLVIRQPTVWINACINYTLKAEEACLLLRASQRNNEFQVQVRAERWIWRSWPSLNGICFRAVMEISEHWLSEWAEKYSPLPVSLKMAHFARIWEEAVAQLLHNSTLVLCFIIILIISWC